MIVMYRGLHCPICSRYLKDLDNKLGQFAEVGVEAVALSSDTEERAQTAKTDWDLPNLTIGYGLDLDTARKWGLYISAGIGKTSAGIEEPELFSEPGLFLVRPDGTVYFGNGSDNALRAARLRGNSGRHQIRARARLSGARRGDRPHGAAGRGIAVRP